MEAGITSMRHSDNGSPDVLQYQVHSISYYTYDIIMAKKVNLNLSKTLVLTSSLQEKGIKQDKWHHNELIRQIHKPGFIIHSSRQLACLFKKLVFTRKKERQGIGLEYKRTRQNQM